MYCIYCITNKVNGHKYIGQHKYEDESNPMGKYKGSGLNLHRAYKKYGIENFETEILYKRVRDKATIDAMEIWAIEKYKPEYNIAKGGSGGATRSGYKCSDEMRTKISKSREGYTYEGRKGAEAPFYGRKHSLETKEKMRKNHIGYLGKKHTNESKNKMSKSHTGKHWKLVYGKRIYY